MRNKFVLTAGRLGKVKKGRVGIDWGLDDKSGALGL